MGLIIFFGLPGRVEGIEEGDLGNLCKMNYSMTQCYHSMAAEISFMC